MKTSVASSWHLFPHINDDARSKSHQIWLGICSLRYAARNAHAPECRLWPVRLYRIFSTLFYKSTIFEKKIIEHKPVFWLSPKALPETFLILGRIKRHLTKNIYWFSCKVPINLLWFQRKLNYLDRFSGNNEISNLIENHPVGADLFHADRRTEMTTLLDAFFAIFRKHLKRVIFNAFWFYLYFV